MGYVRAGAIRGDPSLRSGELPNWFIRYSLFTQKQLYNVCMFAAMRCGNAIIAREYWHSLWVKPYIAGVSARATPTGDRPAPRYFSRDVVFAQTHRRSPQRAEDTTVRCKVYRIWIYYFLL